MNNDDLKLAVRIIEKLAAGKPVRNLDEHLSFLKKQRLPIICICGSSRFAEYHAIARWLFERDGKTICIMINYLPQHYAESEFGVGKNDHFAEASGRKEILDELHKRKIDISDAIFVVDIDGYIGESTRSEMEYAEKLNRPIFIWSETTVDEVLDALLPDK
jgi:hypothetical protein